MSKTSDTQETAPDDAKSSGGDDLGAGLTDDERVSRENTPKGDGANVTLGPADVERLAKK